MNDWKNALHGLLLGQYSKDRKIVRDVFRRSGWILQEPRDRDEALAWARQGRVDVVISESSGWQELLDDLRQLPDAPQLIVTSRTADDHLWAAVLNHGGFDVLPEPFDAEELQRVVAAAGRHAVSNPLVMTAGSMPAA